MHYVTIKDISKVRVILETYLRASRSRRPRQSFISLNEQQLCDMTPNEQYFTFIFHNENANAS